MVYNEKVVKCTNKSLLTVAQVFAVIGGIFLIFPLGVLIFPLVLAFFNFKAVGVLERAKTGQETKERVTNYSIYLLFTAHIIGGICGLIAANSTTNDGTYQDATPADKLKSLDNLYDKGLISKEEYENRRRSIIDNI